MLSNRIRENRVAWLPWVLLAACVWTSGHAASAPEQPVVAITGVSIVDVEQGRTISPRTVLIADGRIAAIGKPSDVRIPPDAQRIDGRGRFLMPGLVDMHVHLFNNFSRRPPNTWTFPLYIANGVTAVREMAAEPASILIVKGWRDAIAKGTLIAPHILAAGVVVYGSSPEDAARQVDVAANVGADFIKVFSEVPESNWRAILEEAHRRSLPVMGHVPAGVSLLASAAAGQRSSEHLMQAFEACTTIERSVLEERRGLSGDELVARRDAQEARVLDAFDQSTCDRVSAALAPSGQAQVPTLVLPFVESKPADRAPESDPRWQYLRADERTRWSRTLQDNSSQDHALAARRWTVARKIVASLHLAGVPVLAGTDSPMPRVYPGFALQDELQLFVESGMSPRDALRSATLAPATFLGIADKTGSVAVGKRADLVLVDGNPLSDIRNTRRIRAVLLDGRLLTRSALDALLSDAAKSAGGD
jgi:imidazolonepropionase-like amidohydrolase